MVVQLTGVSVMWVCLWTVRPAAQMEQAHKHGIRDIDFNTSKPFYLVTCGEDCCRPPPQLRTANPKSPSRQAPSPHTKHVRAHTGLALLMVTVVRTALTLTATQLTDRKAEVGEPSPPAETSPCPRRRKP